MSDENIPNIWIDPDDAPKLSSEWFAGAELRDGDRIVRRGRPKSDKSKQLVSLRLDRDLLARLREQGPGWQTRVNEELRKAVGL